MRELPLLSKFIHKVLFMKHSVHLGTLCLALLSMSCWADDGPRFEKPEVAPVGGFIEVVDRVMSVPCKRWEVTEPNTDGMMITQCKNMFMHFSVDNDFNPVKVVTAEGKLIVDYKPYYPLLAFPLEVGKKWSGKYTGFATSEDAKWDGSVNCEVKAFEKVKVVAGEFDAFRIECLDNWSAMFFFSGTIHTTRWYAPEAKMMIKDVGDNSKWDMELASIGLPASPLANPPAR